jgi:hypothetical protein
VNHAERICIEWVIISIGAVNLYKKEIPMERPGCPALHCQLRGFLFLCCSLIFLPLGRAQDFTIRIGVEEIRLDAVVLDGKGRQITGLTAEDFELYQDDQLQKINAAYYITDQSAPAAKPAVPSKPLKGVSPIPSPMMTRDKTQRVIIFIVDDMSMQFEHVHYARMALEKFVTDQMQPGDLVAILRTSHGISALQMFSSDKRHLLKLVENIRWGDNVRFNMSKTICITFLTDSFQPSAILCVPWKTCPDVRRCCC